MGSTIDQCICGVNLAADNNGLLHTCNISAFNQYEPYKQVIENYLTKVYGERCKTKDIDDSPELKELGNNRCLTCMVWEHYDQEFKAKT